MISAADTQQAREGDDLTWQLVFQSCGGLLLLEIGDRLKLVASLAERERSYRTGCDDMCFERSGMPPSRASGIRTSGEIGCSAFWRDM